MNFLKPFISVIACFYCTAVVSATAEHNGFELMEFEREIKEFIARKVAESFLNGLNRHKGKESRAPVIPELPDPLPIDDVDYDFGELNLDFIEGNVSLSGASIVGLSCIVDDLDFQLIPLAVTYDLKAYTISLQNGVYSLDALLNSATLITGAGSFEASITGPFVNVLVNIIVNLITGNLSVTSVTINLGFEALRIRIEDFAIDGDLFDWEWLDENAAPTFDSFWNAAKEDVENVTKNILNELIQGCSFVGGEFTCIQLPELPFNFRQILAANNGKSLQSVNECNPFFSSTTDNNSNSAELVSQISIPWGFLLFLTSRYVLLYNFLIWCYTVYE